MHTRSFVVMVASAFWRRALFARGRPAVMRQEDHLVAFSRCNYISIGVIPRGIVNMANEAFNSSGFTLRGSRIWRSCSRSAAGRERRINHPSTPRKYCRPSPIVWAFLPL
jgi:hypothetical protein